MRVVIWVTRGPCTQRRPWQQRAGHKSVARARPWFRNLLRPYRHTSHPHRQYNKLASVTVPISHQNHVRWVLTCSAEFDSCYFANLYNDLLTLVEILKQALQIVLTRRATVYFHPNLLSQVKTWTQFGRPFSVISFVFVLFSKCFCLFLNCKRKNIVLNWNFYFCQIQWM